MTSPDHPVLLAVGPLLLRIGATVVEPEHLQPRDVPLLWDGAVIAGIRLPATDPAVGATDPAEPRDPEVPEPAGGLEAIIGDIERQFGSPLAELSRERKQLAVRMFEEGGAFSYRKSVETVAAALGVSRFTVYNYLNRDRE